MGNFSRDPQDRLADALAKHYVGVRLQQGVPVVDADLNQLEDLRRNEFEDVNRRVIGNGVPLGNDGFRIMALDGGGVNTVVLVSKRAGTGLSSLRIILAGSTAAAALGFTTQNASASRFGSSPAQLTGNKAQPFNLTSGSTLIVQADQGAAETITFQSGSFANIAAATAAEVVAVLTTAQNFTARAGTGNDFIIRGGDGTSPNAGRIMVDGLMALNETDLRYSEQALYKNPVLAGLWGVDQVPELTTPAVAEVRTVFLDVWHREVTANEDPVLIDSRIGIETSVRTRREWAVRAVREVDFPAVLAARPPGHSYYVLSRVSRVAGNPAIDGQMISDERDTDLAVRREVAYRAVSGLLLVTSAQLLTRLIETRDNFRDFIQFLTTKFVLPGAQYLAGEIIAIETLSAIAGIADQLISLLNAKSLDTRGALALMAQLAEAEQRFVTMWETVVLPLNKPDGKIYDVAYRDMIARIKLFLLGPAPAGFTALTTALQQRNLFEAARAQEQINASLSAESDRPIGTLLLTWLGSLTATIVRNVPFDLRFRVTGSVTPRDNLVVDVTTDPGWTTTVRNLDTTTPLNLPFGPGNDIKEFLVTVQPPNSDTATSNINLRVSAQRNPSGLTHSSTPRLLRVGFPPPSSEQDLAISIVTTNVQLIGDSFRVPVTLAAANFRFRISNNTNSAINVLIELDPLTAPNWTIVRDPGFILTGSIAGQSNREGVVQFDPPATAGQSLTFTLRVRNPATNAVLIESQIRLLTVAS
jgi:hypothetical protein